MELFISLIIYFITTSLIIFDNGEGAINYGSVIKNVYEKYDSAGVIIASNINYQSFEEVRTVFEIQKELSAQNILSVVIKFEKLKERLEFHYKKTSRPLVVILIDGSNEVDDFRKTTMNINMNYCTWLVLFTSDNDEDGCTYCLNLIGNPLNLKFNSVTLVLCCDSEYIEEWWSTRKNHTDKTIRGRRMNEVDQIEWYADESENRRYSLAQHELRIAIVSGDPHVSRKGDQLHGYLGEVFTELSRAMNFTVSSIIEAETYGSFDPETRLWSGIVGALLQDKADIGVAEIIRTKERQEVVDFTSSVAVSKTALFFRKTTEGTVVPWEAYVKAFHKNIWMMIIILLLTTPILLTIIKYKKKYNLSNMIWEDYLNVWCVFCQHGFPEFPNRTSSRIICISILISALVLFTAYSASLVKNLTAGSPSLPFRTMEEFVNDGSYGLIVIRDSADDQMFTTSKDTLLKNMVSLMKPKSELPSCLQEGLEQVCNERVAFFTNLVMRYGDEQPGCELLHILTGHSRSFAMIVRRDSEYKELINYHLQRFRTYGLMERMKHKYSIKSTPAENIYKPVEIQNITSILFSYGVLFSISIVIFLIERTLHKLNYKIRIMRRKKLLRRLLRNAELSRRMRLQQSDYNFV